MEKHYPDDTKLREWMALCWCVSEQTWRAYSDYLNPASQKPPRTAREQALYELSITGIQQACFLVHDQWKISGEMDVDEVESAVSLFYFVAQPVADILDAAAVGGVNGDGLRVVANGLMDAFVAWDKAREAAHA